MHAKIDIDIVENILKSYARRNRNQTRVYGILLGTINGNGSYHIKNCIYGYIYESKENDSAEQPSVVEFKRLHDSIASSVFSSYSTNFPGQVILGGFSTDKDLFPELFYLYNTISDIRSNVIENHSSLLLLVDPWHQNEKAMTYGVQAFNWKFEEDARVMSYKKISYEIVYNTVIGSNLHSNILNREEMLLNLTESNLSQLEEKKGFSEILEIVKNSVDEELKVKPNTNNSNNIVNLYNLKKSFLLAEKYLIVFEKYLNEAGNDLNPEIVHKLDYITNEIASDLEKEEFIEIIEKEFKQNQIIDYLTNLLNLQIKITEKINLSNI